MEVSFIVSVDKLRSLFGQPEPNQITTEEMTLEVDELPGNAPDNVHPNAHCETPKDSSVEMVQDITLSKLAEKHNTQATETLWRSKLSEFEQRSDRAARIIANQWQKEHKNLEQIIEENLAGNQDMFEKATALRLQFEYEKKEWESSMKSKILNNSSPAVYDSSLYASTTYHRARSTNNGPPFVTFPYPQQQQQADSMYIKNQFEYELQSGSNTSNKENEPHNSSWNGYEQPPPSPSSETWGYSGMWGNTVTHNTSTQTRDDNGDIDNSLKAPEYKNNSSFISKKRKFSCPVVTKDNATTTAIMSLL